MTPDIYNILTTCMTITLDPLLISSFYDLTFSEKNVNNLKFWADKFMLFSIVKCLVPNETWQFIATLSFIKKPMTWLVTV